MLAVLLLTFLLVSDSEQGWVRRAVRRVRIRRVAKFVRKNEGAIKMSLYAARVMGKRSAEPPCPPGQNNNAMDREAALKKLAELTLECPNFGINGQKLKKATVMKAFDKADADNDGAFDDDELREFENILDAYEVCADQGADQGEQE